MKVFIISKYASTPKGGSANRQFMLAKYLNELTDKTTLIYSRSNGKKYPTSLYLYHKEHISGLEAIRINGLTVNRMGIDFRRLLTWFQFEINLFLFFLLLPKSKRPDVVFVSSFSLFSFYTIGILKKFYKFQMIADVRDITPQTEVDFDRIKEGSLIYKFFKHIEMFGYKKADKITSTLPKFDKYLELQKITTKPFFCIPQGIDTKDFEFSNHFKNNNNDSFTIIYAGTIGEVNLVEELCIVASKLVNEDIKFLIYGEGPLRKRLKEKYSYLTNLDFLGRVSRNEIVNILQNADLLINMWGDKGVYAYGVSPNKWIDYMLAARPILVSFNGYRSIINEANCGWFIEANNTDLMAQKILEISKMDKEYLNQLGLNGRNYLFENHNFETLSKKLYNFIKKT